MMRRFYALLPLLVVLLIPTGAWAVNWNYKFTVNGIKYSQNGNEREIRIDLGGGAYNVVVVPEVVVEGLEDDSFDGELVIPDYVEYEIRDQTLGEVNLTSPVVAILTSAFRDCKGITAVSIGENVSSIGKRAFYNCSKLSSFNIPESITYIGGSVFKNTAWEDGLSDGLIYKDKVLLGYKGSKPNGELIITDGTKVIADEAFFECDKLTSLSIPNSVITIGSQTFESCDMITTITIPASVELINYHAFWGILNLSEVYSLIEKPFALGEQAFTPLTQTILYVPVGTKALYEATEGWKEFKNIVEMEPENKELKVGDTFTADDIKYHVTSIDPLEVQVGVYHTSDTIITAVPQDIIGTIIIPSAVTAPDGNLYSVTSIGYQAFRGCINITSVSMPETITEIEPQSFVMCINMSSINIPNSVKTIGYNAFMNCSKLHSISLPNSITSIGFGAFGWCPDLLEVYSYIENPFAINNGGMGDAYNPFDFYREGLTLYIPVGTKAKYEATEGWKEFKNIVEMTPYDVLDDNTVAAHFLEPDEDGKVEIPATVEIDGKTYTVTEIAANAFKDNKELTEVTIPGTVTKIGDGAFAGCENLRAIYVYAPEPISLTVAEARSMVTRAVDNVPSQFEGIDFEACTLYVPIGSEQKYREAEGWKLFTHIVGVEDPSGITTIHTAQNANEAVYNLSGQRLATPKKGLNIIGGKKIVVR